MLVLDSGSRPDEPNVHGTMHNIFLQCQCARQKYRIIVSRTRVATSVITVRVHCLYTSICIALSTTRPTKLHVQRSTLRAAYIYTAYTLIYL